MRRKMRLTDAGVRRLRPDRTEYIVWDSRVSGLGVRVRPSGHRSYVWHGHSNGAAARMTIGSTDLKTIEDARSEILALRTGAHPRSDETRKEQPAVPVFRDFATTEWRQTVTNRREQSSMPIRLSPTTTTFRVLPIARVKLGVSGSGDIASNSEQGPEGVERVERQSRARVSRYERNTTAHDRKNHASATALQLRRGPRQPATLPVKLSM